MPSLGAVVCYSMSQVWHVGAVVDLPQDCLKAPK